MQKLSAKQTDEGKTEKVLHCTETGNFLVEWAAPVEGAWSMDRQEIAEELWQMIRSRQNDAVRLAWLGPEDAGKLGRLDLRGVAEVKRSEKGAFEVKFVDKLKALELLERLSHTDEGEDLDAFLEGLRDGEGL